MKKVGLSLNKMKFEINPISNKNNDIPMLLVKIEGTQDECQYLCKSFTVGETEYVAEYSAFYWLVENECGDIENPQVRLPNGDVISKDEFTRRFWEGDEILI